MAGTLKVDTIQSSASATPPVFKDSTGTEMGQLCRAWVNFNGVTTTTVRAAFNVSSVTRNATGDYTVNFTTALADANYAYTVGSVGFAAGQTGIITSLYGSVTGGASAKNSTGCRVTCQLGNNNTAVDTAEVNVAIFR